jgi:hypothetical protein
MKLSRGADSIISILPFLDPEEGVLIVTLAAYFDESERQSETDPISVAGYLFRPGDYKQFSRAWKGVRKRAGNVNAIHMTDLFAGKVEFRGLSLSRRGEILQDCVDAINEHMTSGVGVVFFQKEFEAAAPEWWPQRFGSIYTAACQIVLQALAYWMKKHGQSQPVSFFFETGHRFQAEANALMVGAGKDPTLSQRLRYESHAFVDKRKAAGLQAADILAWALTKGYGPANQKMKGGVAAAFMAPLMSLAKHKNKNQINVLVGDKLERFFAEQLASGGAFSVDSGPRKRAFR